MRKRYRKIIIVFFVLLALCSSIVACQVKNTSDDKGINHVLLREVSLETSKLITVRLLNEGNAQKVSELLLNNQTFLDKSLKPVKYDKIPWTGLSNTYNMYLHCFYDVEHLSLLYDHYGDNKYLEEAKGYIESWMLYEQSEDAESNRYVWYDHSVSMRTLGMIRFLLSVEESDTFALDEIFIESIDDYLEKQANFLYNESNYSTGNHGLMMDMALMEYGIYAKDSKYFERAIDRITERIEKDFTINGAHVENSSAYHIMVMEYYIDILNILKYYDLSYYLSTDVVKTIELMPQFVVNLSMPNGYLPNIGDSEDFLVERDYGNNEVAYLTSNGEEGVKPNSGVSYYSEAGIAFYREHWNKQDSDNAIWWSIKSGAKSTIHKQDDDLSFMLYGYGNEIFTDAGKYNYSFTDPMRKFCISPLGHNNISVNDESYFARSNFHQIDLLTEKERTPDYVWYTATNRAYGYTHIKRDYIFFFPNQILIVDNVVSLKDNDYQQQFLLAPNMKIMKYDSNGFIARSTDGKANVRLSQHIPPLNAKYFFGDEETQKGFISRKFESKSNSDYIEYLTNGTESSYITTIEIDSDSEFDKLEINIKSENCIRVKNESGEFEFEIDKPEKYEINDNLEKSLVIDSQSVEKLDDGRYKFQLNMHNPNMVYAFYVYKDDKHVDSQSYSSENYYILEPIESGEYAVRFFAVLDSISKPGKSVQPGTKLSGTFDQKIMVDENLVDEWLQNSLEVKERNIKKNEGVYHFSLEMYNKNVQYAFYLYKDGKKIDTKWYSNENYYEFEPVDEGEYQVKYFIVSNQNETPGESAGDQKESGLFDKVIIE